MEGQVISGGFWEDEELACSWQQLFEFTNREFTRLLFKIQVVAPPAILPVSCPIIVPSGLGSKDEVAYYFLHTRKLAI